MCALKISIFIPIVAGSVFTRAIYTLHGFIYKSRCDFSGSLFFAPLFLSTEIEYKGSMYKKSCIRTTASLYKFFSFGATMGIYRVRTYTSTQVEVTLSHICVIYEKFSFKKEVI